MKFDWQGISIIVIFLWLAGLSFLIFFFFSKINRLFGKTKSDTFFKLIEDISKNEKKIVLGDLRKCSAMYAIDDLRIFDREITENEVKQLYYN